MSPPHEAPAALLPGGQRQWPGKAGSTAFAWWALLLAAPVCAGTGLSEPLARPALATPRAAGALLLGITQAGPRLVAVGERGVVLLSDDSGAHWRQAAVPVSNTLTAVRFVDDRQGWAVGHAGVVLHSGDGGQTWTRQLDGKTAAALVLKSAPEGSPLHKTALRLVADGSDKPLLDLHFFDARRGLVIGAYGLVFGTEDGGATWAPWLDRIDNPKGLHLNAVAVRGNSVLLAGEQGLLLHSSDAGRSFTRLASPYEGSWFAAATPAAGRWLVGGLRGRAYLWDEAGNTFAAAVLSIPVSLSTLSVLPNGRVVALNQAGQALLSRDGGQHFVPLSLPPGPPMTALQPLADGSLIASSLRGVRLLPAQP